MTSLFKRPFDEILNEILTNYSNLDEPPADLSRGSQPRIMGEVLTKSVYGLLSKMDFLSKQIVPNTSTATEFLDLHGDALNLPRFQGESNGDYLNRILNRMRNPPSGGNANDYKVWTLDRNAINVVDGSDTYYNAFATITDAFPVAGNVHIATIPNDESIIGIPSNTPNEEALRVATFDYIMNVDPLGILNPVVVASKPVFANPIIDIVAGQDWNPNAAEGQIIEYGASLSPSETFYSAQLVCICLENGAISAVPTTGDLVPNIDQHVRVNSVVFNLV